MKDLLILVDENDNEIGTETKDACHRNPVPLHRAFSIFVFNKKGQLLIQKRASSKKTWGGCWSNTVCSHPRKGETLEEATQRRLQEEFGFTTSLHYVFTFTYEAQWNDIWGEHEVDNVFFGTYDGPIAANKNEIEDWKFVDTGILRANMKRDPDAYTPWFKLSLERVLKEK